MHKILTALAAVAGVNDFVASTPADGETVATDTTIKPILTDQGGG